MLSQRLLAIIIFSWATVSLSSAVRAREEIPFVPTPMEVVDRMLELAEVNKADVVYDLGSGDGRIVIRVAKKYGARGVGIEADPELVELSQKKAREEGVEHLVEFRVEDALKTDLSSATVVTLYMFPWFNEMLRPKLQKLKPGSRVVSHDFSIKGWKGNQGGHAPRGRAKAGRLRAPPHAVSVENREVAWLPLAIGTS